MRTSHFTRRSLSALAVVMVGAGLAFAQDRPSPILNSVEVRQLAARAEAADQARLGSHFSALADRYAADAERHTAMARAFGGNPNRSLATDMPVHCKRLAQLSTESATVLRELAAHHRKLAGGSASEPPAAGAKFEAGAGAREPNEADLYALAGKANTPADHRLLQDYYLAIAKRYDSDAASHSTMAATYRSNSRLAGAAVHCDRLVEKTRGIAQESRAAAAMHATLAGDAGK
jgi:hypothetical protein